MTDISFDPALCDLCGASEKIVLVAINEYRSMRSDRAISDQRLGKVACARCGLVRSDEKLPGSQLSTYYADQYTLSTQAVEHYFYTQNGPVSRSAMIADWLVQSMGIQRWQPGTRCLEIGAGSGDLLKEMSLRFPDSTFEGIELSKEAAAIAQARGLNVQVGDFDILGTEQFDIIYSIAVIEHVPSPTEFLRQIHTHLRPGGWLFLCQPTQDVPSYDLFFVDHLHHFGTEHLRQYARKCGFVERGFCVGHAWMPNFSVHLWQAADVPLLFEWVGEPGYTTCAETARQTVQDFDRLDQTLSTLQNTKVAAFGLNEVYWLARAYTSVATFPFVCGLDDTPDKPEYNRLGFPVIRPEQCASYDVHDVILTMNKIYYPQAIIRLQALGLKSHPFLS